MSTHTPIAQEISIGFIPIARPTFDVALAQAMTAQVRAALAAAGFGLVGPPDLVMDAEGMAAAIDQFKSTPPDFLLVLQASFADSTLLLQVAAAAQVPLLLWGLPEERVGGRLRLNSFCGINLGGHALRRAGHRYDYLYATPDDPAALDKIRAMAAAVLVKKRLSATKIGRVGENPAGFETCLVNYEALAGQFGVQVVQLELQDLFARARSTPQAAVMAVAQGVRAQLRGVDALDAEATHKTLSAYLSLRDMAAEAGLNGLAVRCWPEFFTDLGCAACGAMSMLSNAMTPCSCEADVNGTLTQLILQWLSGGAAFGTDVVSFDLEEDIAIVWHCGLAPLSMADPDYAPEAALHSNRQMPLLMQFPLKPGRVTVARLSEATGQFRLVVGVGEMLKAPPSFTGTSGTLRFESGAQAVMQTIMQEGLEHHLALTYGDHREALVLLAGLLGLPVLRL